MISRFLGFTRIYHSYAGAPLFNSSRFFMWLLFFINLINGKSHNRLLASKREFMRLKMEEIERAIIQEFGKEEILILFSLHLSINNSFQELTSVYRVTAKNGEWRIWHRAFLAVNPLIVFSAYRPFPINHSSFCR